MFDYYKLSLKLLTDQLGTCTKASIYDEHILKKAQKMIKEANRQGAKVRKALEKYKGEAISPTKELEELKGIIRRYEELLGKKSELPDEADELLDHAKTLEEEFDELAANREQRQATVFMRTADGKIQVSTHMILGNLKENAKISTNNSTEGSPTKLFKSKVSVQESLSLDVKPVEEFMYPNGDISRDEKGQPKLLERPIRFERMGHTETAIALSEVLPAGTEYSPVHLRVRKGSVVTEDVLRQLLDLGKNNGLGQWRGSGHKGSYCFKLEKVDAVPTNQVPDGWS